MKYLIMTFALLIGTQNARADDAWIPVPQADQSKYLIALYDALRTTKFTNCTVESGPGGTAISDSNKWFGIPRRFTANENFNMEISKTGKSLKVQQTVHVGAENPPKDYKFESIHLITAQNTISQSQFNYYALGEINGGTVLNPHYEIVWNIYDTMACNQ
jgi:hypothetical protein